MPFLVNLFPFPQNILTIKVLTNTDDVQYDDENGQANHKVANLELYRDIGDEIS